MESQSTQQSPEAETQEPPEQNVPSSLEANGSEAEEELQRETRAIWEREQSELKSDILTYDTEMWQTTPDFTGLQRVGGVDLSFIKGDDVNACASLVVLSFPELEVIYEECQMVCLTAPYVAGYLAFREAPSLVGAIERLQRKDLSLMPQVLFVDGNGILHHRGFGVACHLGVLTGLPCIGVAKNLLMVDGLENNDQHKEQIRELQQGGDQFCLTGISGTVLGMALKSCDKSAKPIYVSVGHKISLETAVRLCARCCKFRNPEPIRQADIRSREYIRMNFPVSDVMQGCPGPKGGKYTRAAPTGEEISDTVPGANQETDPGSPEMCRHQGRSRQQHADSTTLEMQKESSQEQDWCL